VELARGYSSLLPSRSRKTSLTDKPDRSQFLPNSCKYARPLVLVIVESVSQIHNSSLAQLFVNTRTLQIFGDFPALNYHMLDYGDIRGSFGSPRYPPRTCMGTSRTHFGAFFGYK
jgi:hypothetical protein